MIYLSMIDNKEERNVFKERYEQFYPCCLHIANVILRDPMLAEDAVHEAFLSIVKHRKKYLSISCSDFHRSIVVIVRHKCIDIMRKRERMPDIKSSDKALSKASDGKDLEDQVVHRDEIQKISGYINLLDEVSRQALYLRYIERMSYREIGAALGISEKNAGVRTTRAKMRVRRMIEEARRRFG